jgi:hypothetical protein
MSNSPNENCPPVPPSLTRFLSLTVINYNFIENNTNEIVVIIIIIIIIMIIIMYKTLSREIGV